MPAAAQVAVVPLLVSTVVFPPIAKREDVLVPVPMMRSPVVVMGETLLNAVAFVPTSDRLFDACKSLDA